MREYNKQIANKVYSKLLQILPLTNNHAHILSARGLTPEEIKGLNYKSLSIKRAPIIEDMVKEFRSELGGVPGFWRDSNGKWKLAGSCGILIPVRDREGLIVAIKIRADKPLNPQSKYTLLSSNPKPNPKTGEVKYPEGTAAHLCPHHPLDRGDGGGTMRITEGEIKADIATNITSTWTISIPGVGFWKYALEAIEEQNPEHVLIAFDSDKDHRGPSSYVDPAGEPVSVAKSLGQLYLAVKETGRKVSIETWPAEAGKGIDDVLIGDGAENITLMAEAEADAFAEESAKGELPMGWTYVMGVKRFIHTELLIEMDREQFDAFHLHEHDSLPSTLALRNPGFPKAHYPVYMPNRDSTYEKMGLKYFNLWRQFPLEAAQGDVSPFMEHIEYILPDAREAGILLDWLAFCVQNPGEKAHWAILLQGTQGTGKSYIGWVMREILGETNVSFPSNDTIHEVYTGWAKSSQLIVVEELMARGRLDLMNKLKPMITQPTVSIREMHKPPYEQPNVFNLLMFTNHEDAIIIDKSDRRYCVLFSKATPRNSSYYEKIWSWSAENKAAILYELRTRDISKFKPKGHAPMTAGKKTLIKESMMPLEAWMREGIESQSWPFMGDIVCTSHLAECLPRSLSNVSAQALGKTLKAIEATQLGQIPLENGSRMRLWAVRRGDTWRNESPENISAEYARWGNEGQPGGNPLLEAKPM